MSTQGADIIPITVKTTYLFLSAGCSVRQINNTGHVQQVSEHSVMQLAVRWAGQLQTDSHNDIKNHQVV